MMKMTIADMKLMLKVGGWRLRSKRQWPDTRKRRWYVEDDRGVIAVSPRTTQWLALRWGVAVMTGNAEVIQHLRWIEAEEEYMK